MHEKFGFQHLSCLNSFRKPFIVSFVEFLTRHLTAGKHPLMVTLTHCSQRISIVGYARYIAEWKITQIIFISTQRSNVIHQCQETRDSMRASGTPLATISPDISPARVLFVIQTTYWILTNHTIYSEELSWVHRLKHIVVLTSAITLDIWIKTLPN